MISQTIARGLLAALCSLQGVGTIGVNLNCTHAKNPGWPAHAKFHLVWQVATVALLAVLEVGLVLSGGPLQAQRFYLATVLACIPMLGFFAAFFGKGLYRGASSDPSERLPTTVTLPGSHVYVDLNLIAETAAVLVLGAIIVLYSHAGAAH